MLLFCFGNYNLHQNLVQVILKSGYGCFLKWTKQHFWLLFLLLEHAGGRRKMVLQLLHSIRGKLYAFATTTHSRSIGVALCMKSTHLTPPYNHTSDIVCMFAIICGEKKCVCVCLCVLYACVCLIESLREMNESLYANAEKTKRNFRLFFFVVISTRFVSKNAWLFQNPFLKHGRFLGSSLTREGTQYLK